MSMKANGYATKHISQIIWEFFPEGDTADFRANNLFNFYNPQFIPDQNQDGIKDILISNGGDVTAEPYSDNRPAGSLMFICGRTGQLVSKATMPDGKEIYMSVLVDNLDNNDTLDIIYGTGGETVGGGFYRSNLPALMAGDLSKSALLATGEMKGFIGPPVIADVNGDDIPDFFTVFAIGTWPMLESIRPLLVDGSKGQIVFMDSIGFYQMSSPVLADFNKDGNIDGLLNVNFFKPNENGDKTIHNTMLVYDFSNRTKFAITEPLVGSNVASTPWVGDLDDDGYLDIIYCNMTTPDRVYTFDGMCVIRVKTTLPVNNNALWGSYMGNDHDGIYTSE